MKRRLVLDTELATIKEYLSYDPKTGILKWIKRINNKIKNSFAGGKQPDGYIRIGLKNKEYLAHRVAWFLYHDEWPELEIDHINGNRSDNRIINLRHVTAFDNYQNSKIHRKGRPLGVTRNNGKWRAVAPRQFLNYKAPTKTHIGYFDTMEEAGQAVIDFCSKA